MSQRPGTHVPAVRVEAEKNLGITHRSAAINFAWTGDIRKRYTDFLVNEIRKDGTVMHLRDYEEDETPPQASTDRDAFGPSANKQENKTSQNVNKPENTAKVTPISEDDRKALVALIGEPATQKLIALDENIQAKKQLPPAERTVSLDPVTDRPKRATIHQEIRRIFHSRFETVADSAGIIKATPAKRGSGNRTASQNWNTRRDNNRNRDQPRDSEFAGAGGPYLHFTLYKENKDTMDAVNTIARLLKIKASNFGFAGTKDRRAGTVQRISVYRQKPSNLIWLNTRIPNVKVGDFAYAKDPLQLGQHGGNEFVITLKNCQPLGGENCSLPQRMKMIQQAVECGLAYLKHNGYINYYGLQRFGTYTIGTHLLGMKILKGDYEGFIDDVLHVDDGLLKDVLSNAQPYASGKDAQATRDDQNRARAITTWKTTKSAAKALEFLPKRFSSETAIIRHLGKNPKDFTGAVLSITRGMRMMYVHAYQSYIWNFVATRRWSKYGPKVIEGDLVLVKGIRRRSGSDDEDDSPQHDYDDDETYAQARPLSSADVASGNYSIFDVVLPTPGYDVIYPSNEIGDYYVEFMGRPENGALSPYNMRHKQREFSLSGNYRFLIGRLIGTPEYAVCAYSDDTEQMYPTDLDYAIHKKNAEKAAKTKARPVENVGPNVQRWIHFSQNAALYDNALDALTAERRRKADEQPKAEYVLNETWVQTGLDGNNKRVKVARHHHKIEPGIGSGLGGDPSGGAPLTDVSDDVPPLMVKETEADAKRTPSPVGGGAALTDRPQDASPPRIYTDGPFPMISVPKGSIPKSEIRGVSDAYYAQTGRVPYFGPLPTGVNMQPAGGYVVPGSQHSDIKPESSAPFDLKRFLEDHASAAEKQGGKSVAETPAAQFNAPAPDAQGGLKANWNNTSNASLINTDDKTAPVNNEKPNGSSDTELINGVPVPKLRAAPDNPLSSMTATAIDESSIDPKATKIAVTLKFQLKTSNYATIVLRELMGTTAQELAH